MLRRSFSRTIGRHRVSFALKTLTRTNTSSIKRVRSFAVTLDRVHVQVGDKVAHGSPILSLRMDQNIAGSIADLVQAGKGFRLLKLESEPGKQPHYEMSDAFPLEIKDILDKSKIGSELPKGTSLVQYRRNGVGARVILNATGGTSVELIDNDGTGTHEQGTVPLISPGQENPPSSFNHLTYLLGISTPRSNAWTSLYWSVARIWGGFILLSNGITAIYVSSQVAPSIFHQGFMTLVMLGVSVFKALWYGVFCFITLPFTLISWFASDWMYSDHRFTYFNGVRMNPTKYAFLKTVVPLSSQILEN